ncbi:SDR family NAD(P)-dependent oxidoreductase [Trinickia terrae]|uniref:SDR family NAD(P)-dependent oxidoreductase n=1 Tax=Trinickia terrae TaxID=2571161 RepID=A0A4U1HNP5_9BURK|nr:NAD-binding protein [Trinickia terrae]TKC82979.1 SDR family NAD(P)-dependent oxidoreductase [Trinickia terrae]
MNATRILRRPRVLIVGCGDVGMRCVERLRRLYARTRIVALTSHLERVAELRGAGVTPIVGDLDAPHSLRRLNGIASTVLHLAPPQKAGDDDRRTRALIAALSAPRRLRPSSPRVAATGRRLAAVRARRAGISASEAARIVPDAPFWSARPVAPIRLVYASTTGVYGDCGGALIDETRPVNPANERAKRRVSAERQLRRASARGVLAASIVRIPGIYARNRLPLARLEKGTPALIAEDDVYTNHIHADDLAAILLRAARRARVARVIHASDDSALKMGEYFDRVADAFALPRAPRITREAAEQQLEPMLLSFMRESRRLSNARLKRELRIRLRYPSVDDFLSTVR